MAKIGEIEIKRTKALDPLLSVVIVSYNTRELTLKAIRSLYENTQLDFSLVVFDNASSDGSADAIFAEFPEVDLIRSSENIGFAAANNEAVRRIRSKWVLLLNPDTEVYSEAIDNLVKFGEKNPRGGIYGGRTVFPDGSLNVASCWRRITLWSVFCSSAGLTAFFPNVEFFNPEAMPSWGRDTVRNVDVVVGCFLLIRRSLWNELGGFNLRYFMYGEEADLCARAKELGYKPMITPDATIMHIVGAASPKKPEKVVAVARARATLMRDHWPRWQIPLGVTMMWLWAASRGLVAEAMFFFKPTESSRRRREQWSHVWRSRSSWLYGYR